MRTLIVSAAALIATSAPVAAFAAVPTTVPEPAPALHAVANGAGATSLQTTSTTKKSSTTKKKKKKKSSSESASFESIGTATRGKKGLEIQVKVSKSDRTCELKVTWKNDTSSNDDDTSGSDKLCTFSIDVPDSSAVVGDAKASVTVKDSSGKKVASSSKTFTVK